MGKGVGKGVGKGMQGQGVGKGVGKAASSQEAVLDRVSMLAAELGDALEELYATAGSPRAQ